MATAINNLTKDDVAALLQLTDQHLAGCCIPNAHENPKDEFYANELAKFKRIRRELYIAWTQKP